MQTQPQPKSLLVVAEANTQIVVPATKNAVRVTDIHRIFPVIHEWQPTVIVLDYDFLGNDTEKILRRLTSNPFYNKIKIYCYKSRPHTKVDGLLTALGVQQFIYSPVAKTPKTSVTGKILNYISNATISVKLAKAN
ncbi:hypothetical protein [Mucilaginibacter antarcticus]